MGKILSGILSKVSGKVAGVVGGSWKDVAYLRAYVKPANPNTAAQQTQRTKFSDAVNFAKPLVGQIFNTYTDKFQKSMSGFNFFIKRNIDVFDGSVDYSLIKATEGPLSVVEVTSSQLVGTTVTVSYNPNYGNNGLGIDKVFAFTVHEPTGIVYFASAETDRDDGAIDMTVHSGLTATDLHSYTITAKYISNVLDMISNSVYEAVSA